MKRPALQKCADARIFSIRFLPVRYHATPRYPCHNRDCPGAYLGMLVPLFSFGGAALGILAWTSGTSIDLRVTAAGCVCASFALVYLAWIRPKKDIVALTTPIYALIFFAVPLDDPVATITLELLYAISLSILLVRLNTGSVRPGRCPSGGRPPRSARGVRG